MTADAPVFQFDAAIVRQPSKSVVYGLRGDGASDPDLEELKAEHEAYVTALGAAGLDVAVLPPLEAYPDAIFVEDPALVFPEGAILLRSAAPSRIGEAKELAPALNDAFDTVLTLPEEGYVDGGDVLTTPSKVLIGLSSRTNRDGAEALQTCLAELGRESEIVSTPTGVLHFKSDCSLLDSETVLVTERLAQSSAFDGFKLITTPKGEEAAANALRINDVVLASAQFPHTIELLKGEGFNVAPLSTVEIGKLDAGLSCMSLRWKRAQTTCGG